MQYEEQFNDPSLQQLSDQYQQAQFGRTLFRSGNFVPLGVNFVEETTVFREFGPLAGRTMRVGIEFAPKMGEATMSRKTLDADARYYLRMDQRNETFLPHVLAVDQGTIVDFPNNDTTYHNVFSISKTRKFDLGRYARGKSKSVTFDRPGVVRIFCDIHSHMSAFVLVFSHPYYAKAEADGRYRIDNVPPGTYTVLAWHEGETRDTRTVTIPPQGGDVDLDFVIQ